MATRITPDVICLTANNPSPMTYTGTNTYIVGQGSLSVIDPGPDLDDHLEAILACGQIDRIILTHSHIDHTALVPRLKAATGAVVYAYGDSDAGRSAVMTELSAKGLIAGGEGVDHSFTPDHLLADGDVIAGMTVIHTPGHMGNHICLVYGDLVFTGDHVMGWATSIVSPPDGDLTDFMASCRKLRSIPARLYLAGHGDPVENPHERLDWLIAHRLSREAQIIATLGNGPATASELTKAIYTDVPAALLPAAERNVIAHLIDLTVQNRIAPIGPLSADARFSLV